MLGDEAQKLGLYFGSWLLVGMLLVLLELLLDLPLLLLMLSFSSTSAFPFSFTDSLSTLV